MRNDVWVVIPARNEQKTIGAVLQKTKKLYSNIVVVDDGSTDKTAVIAKKYATVLRHIVNMGKGAALKTGCDYAVKKVARKIVVMDADSQHSPADIAKFLKKLAKKDIVFGYRQLDEHMPLILMVGNQFINQTTKLLYKMNLRDTQCGFRAFTAAAYKKIRWKANDYSMESEMIANAGKHTLRYAEVPIATIYKDRYKGTTVLDGMKIVRDMLLWKLKR